MFEKVGIPILGIVENMSMHVCSNCGHAEHHLRRAAARRCAPTSAWTSWALAADHGNPPADRFRQAHRGGRSDGKVAEIYKAIARKVAVKVAEKARDMTSKFPSIVVQND
jgi:ATP-binding protein involved in chromosome partitioning